jgi:hypothetical protein
MPERVTGSCSLSVRAWLPLHLAILVDSEYSMVTGPLTELVV